MHLFLRSRNGDNSKCRETTPTSVQSSEGVSAIKVWLWDVISQLQQYLLINVWCHLLLWKLGEPIALNTFQELTYCCPLYLHIYVYTYIHTFFFLSVAYGLNHVCILTIAALKKISPSSAFSVAWILEFIEVALKFWKILTSKQIQGAEQLYLLFPPLTDQIDCTSKRK